MKTLIINIYQNRKFNKLFFLLEFIFTFLLVFTLFKYGSTSDKMYYYLVFVSGFFLAFSLILLVVKYRKKLEYLFLIIIIPLGLGYLILLLPNYVPDEGSHIAKTYTVSEFDLFPNKNKDDEPIMKVPIQLEANSMSEINSYQDIDYIMSVFDVKRLHCVATDGCALLLREAIDAMDDDTFRLFLKYHFATCEREDLVGITSHALDIFQKI